MKRLFSILLLMLALVMVLAACNGNDEVTISVDSDGYVIVNGVKTEHKVHTADQISVNGDGFVVVNGVVTDIVADKDDVITVDADGYLVVNGVKSEHEVKNKNHSFGAWKLYNEGETDCEKKLYYRICSECSTIEWKEGTYEDHNWTTVTTAPTCQAGGFDTKTCNTCGKVEIGNETPVGEHTYLTDYSYDNSNHWLVCQNCSNIKDKAEHTMDAEGGCMVCSQLVGDTEGVIYDISPDKTHAVVIDYTGTATRVKIAAEYQGLPVTQIYENAFNEKNITAVIIPDSVTTIGGSAFSYCYGLTSVTIPDSVTTIGDYAFYYCTGLTSVTIGNGVTTIGDVTFYCCTGLTSVTIPDSVTTIGDNAFQSCSSLISVTIGNGVTTIGEWAFSDCSSLTSVHITDLAAWTKIEFGNSDGNPLCNDAALYLNGAMVTNLVLPDSVTTIGDNAFYGCSSLTSVTIPDSVTTIGYSAFYNCSRLTGVTIGNGVTTIGEDAFYNCSSLQYAEYGNCKYLGSADNPYFALITVVNNDYSSYTIHEDTKIIANCAFFDCNRITAITIPNGMTSIGIAAFYNCSSLTSVTIGNGVTTIGAVAFHGCSSLTGVTIPDSVTTIGSGAFFGCSSLTSVTIPDSVTTIGDSAFYSCSSLTSVTIGNGVTTIGSRAFYGCSSLTEIHFGGTKEQWRAIQKGNWWNSGTGNYIVHCTDGDLNY